MKQESQTTSAWGIDACRSGWIAAGPDGQWLHSSDLAGLLAQMEAGAVLIDMPIGLSGEGILRKAEESARKIMGRKASSVFTPPCRKAVYAADYQTACALQEAETGQRISIQAWNIVPRIRALDALLQLKNSWRERLFESHPELNFCLLNGGTPLFESKKTAAGLALRLQLLERYLPGAEQVFDNARSRYQRRQVQDDDLADALCLQVVSTLPGQWLDGEAPLDAKGLRMGFWVPEDGMKL